MKRTALLLPALALSFGFVTAGCGGSDEDSLTHDEFVTQADKICADGDAEIASATEDIDTTNQEDVDGFVQDTLVPNLQDQHDAIEELSPPDDDANDVDDMLDELQQGIDALSDDPSMISSDSDVFGDANTIAGDLGLKECGAN